MEDSSTQTDRPKKTQDLGSQAATAALYVTRKENEKKAKSILDTDNKLSSASAATSLKYAQPQDLPSFPIVGINQDSSAGAAASIAAANQKSFEHWKPGHSAPANKAAMLAKDYKMEPLWQPEASAGASKAASLAAREGADTDIWKPEATAAGSSAAGQAFRKKGLGPDVDYAHKEGSSSRALQAASDAMSGKHRAVPNPNPGPLYPDAANSAANALKAATKANQAPALAAAGPVYNDLPGLSAGEASKIHKHAVTNMKAEMYSYNPPVAPEVDERNKEAGIRAAAVTMAQAMYVKAEETRKSKGYLAGDSLSAARSSHKRADADDLDGHVPAKYAGVGLQQAAQKLANERLAKLHDTDREYRDYYGAHSVPKSRISMRGRRPSSSEGAADTDRAHAEKIRKQQSGLNSKLAEVDSQKRETDRAALLAAAQRNVRNSMAGIDEKVFQQTGKASPAMTAEWDAKARARAEAESSVRLANHGKVAIGGGKYMDQSEIDAIAAGRVQPTLDEIALTAEEHRARDEARRQATEEEKRIREARIADEKERDTKTKSEWRRFKEEEKEEQRAKKEAERAQKAEQRAEEKRLREEQLKALNEEETRHPQDQSPPKEKRKSGLAAIFSTKRKSTPQTGYAAQVTGGTGTTELAQGEPAPAGPHTTRTGNVLDPAVHPPVDGAAADSRRSSTSLETSDDEPVFVAAPTTVPSENNASAAKDATEPSTEPTSELAAEATSGLPKHQEPVTSRIAVPATTTTTTTAVTGGNDKDARKESKDPKDGKKSSWFKRLSTHRSNKATKPEEAPKDGSTTTIEPITGLPIDTRLSNPGFGTDNIPHIQPVEAPSGSIKGVSTSKASEPTEPDAAAAPPVSSEAVSPVEADAMQAKQKFTADTNVDTAMAPPPQHMPTSAAAGVGEFLPSGLIPATATGEFMHGGGPEGSGMTDSERDVAMAGKRTRTGTGSRSTSPGSEVSEGAPAAGRGRTGRGNELERESTNDEFEEAQDTVDAGDLPQPKFQGEKRQGESPARETKFKELFTDI